MKKILYWLAVLFWMAVIFYLSSQVAEQSNQLSTGLTETIIKVVERIIPNSNFDIEIFNHIIRKNAHFFAYLVLGILVINALRRSEVYRYKCFFIALFICILYAISDEVHQLFVPGRGGQIKDVIIDSVGASVGMALYWIIKKIRYNYR